MKNKNAKLLIFPLAGVSEMAKGKGNRLMAISKSSRIVFAALCGLNQTLTLVSAKKKLILKPSEWKGYMADIGSRGQKLPKGTENIQTLTIT